MSTKLNKKLLYWEYVEIDEEPEKFFRYNCFQRKWLKITKQPGTTARLLEAWANEASTLGTDIVINIVRALEESTDPEFYLELVEAAKVIAYGDVTGLSQWEISEARQIATDIFKDGILDEILELQMELTNN